MPRHATRTVVLVTLAGLLLWPAAAPAAEKAAPKPKRRVNSAMAPIEDVAGLPRVLLLGDSISIGYTVPVRDLLKGKANVHRARQNCGPTTRGLESLDAWLGEKKWDVIHFNFGLHDLKYINEKGGLVAVDEGRQQVPIDAYRKNLEQIVARLEKTGAALIWCATTPVPEGAKGRVVGDAVRYNAAAAEVMAKHKIPTNDLYAFAKPRLEKIQQPANVHFTPEGSKALAEQVVKHVLAALEKRAAR